MSIVLSVTKKGKIMLPPLNTNNQVASFQPDKPITEVIVDPDRSHLGESFVIKIDDVNKRQSKVLSEKDKEAVAQRVAAANAKAINKMASVNQDSPVRVGVAIPNSWSAGTVTTAPTTLPEVPVNPPRVKVTFDISGIGAISFKYHNVIVKDNHVVFATDKRSSQTAEFYPYMNLSSSEPKRPVAMYVEGSKSIHLLNPNVDGFPFVFENGPFEYCVVPVSCNKVLDTDSLQEMVGTGGSTDGENGGNTQGPDTSPGEDSGFLEAPESGSGGVL
jgi:hypothetical protein